VQITVSIHDFKFKTPIVLSIILPLLVENHIMQITIEGQSRFEDLQHFMIRKNQKKLSTDLSESLQIYPNKTISTEHDPILRPRNYQTNRVPNIGIIRVVPERVVSGNTHILGLKQTK
jgi:hypothetical protein